MLNRGIGVLLLVQLIPKVWDRYNLALINP